mmetsp:Transcript_4179/g.6162  ORF Transcript_4179/g.6162 Transcript_4179/m.6162 type:complete len:368 (+) Transcript_4179:54-1157(+)|eukprot:CAMPEP_0202458464 /NCGR_PEP_ID=MMETSP1360-20130828/25581_1 /ASSEMBLY_ACC=CAM_ASM_000848 /TAXON_ID=515479 /ORGANISM="Licmophora paradoxa, Strain CCMP2313" /LENGTH=367 /DNA_ID=CAMNT_0049079019 /DNA_START=42 /DNA_END=1145 /DNA_ORIENTATION=-
MSAPIYTNATASAVSQRGTPATLNLDDIFGDVLFTPDGDTVFLSDLPPEEAAEVVGSGEGPQVASRASRVTEDGRAVPVQNAGGVHTTNLNDPSKRALVMGGSEIAPQPAKPVPYKRAPQQRHHLQYATPEMMASLKKKKKSERNMSEAQKSERRERNREHAKRSRIRKKFLLESLQQSVSLLKEENEKLKQSIRAHLGQQEADQLLQAKGVDPGIVANNQMDANKVLDDPDFSFIKALQTAQQNFVVTDPSLPDNPIVYATQGFLNLTGYTLDQVLGRNCRFLQGPETDPKAVEKIRKSIEDGTDMSVCLLNYRVDGTTFWNQFFIAALRDSAGNITNYVGVQCKVSDQYAANVCKKQDDPEEEDD